MPEEPDGGRQVAPLQLEEDASLGLFYILRRHTAADRMQRWKPDEPADGMAFVVSADGTLATAAHVIWGIGLQPGDVVDVFGAHSSLPLQGKALVLENGWRGPRPDDEGTVRHPLFEDALEGRRDVLREDCALLQLDFTSLRFDAVCGGEAPDRKALLARLRFLPIGAPSYPRDAHVAVTAWRTNSLNGAVQLISKTATFKSTEPSLHHAIQLHGPEIVPGFSGSPLWDARRRLCIGFVRSGVSVTPNGDFLGTDARALARFGHIPLSCDAELMQVVAAARALLRQYGDRRHEAIAVEPDYMGFVEPDARPLFHGTALDAHDDDPGKAPALTLLLNEIRQSKIVCLQSGAGSGKSTLLRELARRLLANHRLLGTIPPVLPILLDAAEFDAADFKPVEGKPRDEAFSVAAFLKIARQYAQAALLPEQQLEQALVRNDASILLMIDGLDEIDHRQVPKLLSLCEGLVTSVPHVFGVIVATRPMPYAPRNNRNRWHMPLLELMPFTPAQVRQFAALHFTTETDRDAYLHAVAQVDWMSDASPLQLEMAAALYNQPAGLPSREADLVFGYIELRLAEHDGPASRSAVLGVLASANLRNEVLTGEHIKSVLLEHFGAAGEPLAQAIEHEPAASGAGLFHIRKNAGGSVLQWEHRTIMEALAAQDVVAAMDPDPARQLVVLRAVKAAHGHRFQLVILCAMERAGFRNAVEKRLEEAIAAPFSAYNETLLAFRALAAGIAMSDVLRRKLVTQLVRVALSPRIDSLLCAEVYTSSSDLPTVLRIIQRPELRDDVAAALLNMLKWRDPRRHGSDQPLVLNGPMAKLLDILYMWNQWRDSGLELAKGGGQDMPRRMSHALPRPPDANGGNGAPDIIDRGEFTVVDHDGLARTYEIPARLFLEGVAAMAQNLPRHISPSHVVHLYLRAIGSRGTPPGQARGGPTDLAR
jgi:hypothetical protein